MSDLYDDEPPNEPTPEELCRQAFSRCSNWPEDRAGQLGLFQGLKAASERYRISQPDLIARCREQSSFCPTDHDLMVIGAELFKVRADAIEAGRDRTQEWRKQYGPPKKMSLEMKGKCLDCGSDWSEIIATAQARQKALWEGLKAHFQPKREGRFGFVKWPKYREMAPVARQLGFAKEADAWERYQ
jgi:hypothetical protein